MPPLPPFRPFFFDLFLHFFFPVELFLPFCHFFVFYFSPSELSVLPTELKRLRLLFFFPPSEELSVLVTELLLLLFRTSNTTDGTAFLFSSCLSWIKTREEWAQSSPLRRIGFLLLWRTGRWIRIFRTFYFLNLVLI